MGQNSEPDTQGYSARSKWLHWLVALIVVGLIPVGLVMADLKPGPLQDRLFVLHESFGVIVLALMTVRLANRLYGAPSPEPSLARWERILSDSVHNALYALLLLTPALGWMALSAYGLGPSFLGLGELPTLLEKDEPFSKTLFALHKGGGLAIIGLVVMHVVGVVRHIAVKRDRIAQRMLPG